MLTQLLVWLNQFANVVGTVVLAPVEYLPGWLSATLIAIVTGAAMLVMFKYTSNQKAIKRARDQINANLLAISLFKDHLGVSLRCQGRLFGHALVLLWHSLRPMAIMTIPMVLALGQIALWYQARPLTVGEESIVTVQVKPGNELALEQIELAPLGSVKVVTGPVRVPNKNMICWNLASNQAGLHRLDFQVDGKAFSKDLVVGGQFRSVSLKRPSFDWMEVLVHPREQPFAVDSVVQSIEVAYPKRDSWTSGTNLWIVYWFVVSMVAAFAVKPFLNVNI